MTVIFRHALARLRGQIYGWGLTFAILGWITTWAYDAIMSDQAQWQRVVNQMPLEMWAFFGEIAKLFTPGGYLDVGLFSYGIVILCFFSIVAASGMLASDEEAGRLDLVQAHPVSRTALFAGRFLAMTVATIAILACTWGGLALGMIGSSFPVSLRALVLPHIVMFAQLMLFAGLALWLSMALPSRTLAASVASFALVASYAVTSLAREIKALRGLARLSPLNYYQSGYAIDGIKWGWFLPLLAAAALLVVAAWWAYQRRDLRVSGEGNWRLPALRRR